METEKIVKYFQAPKNYFWHWAEGGKVIEFSNGATVCYREDLLFILQSLNIPSHLPFGTFILLFCACKNDFETTYSFEAALQDIYDQSTTQSDERTQLQQLLDDSLVFLRLINSLSYSYRMGLKRIPLYQAIFEEVNTNYNKDWLKGLVGQFNTGNWDDLIFNHTGGPLLSFKNILRPLAEGLKRFPTKEALELKLRTGLSELPQKVEEIVPESLPANLFDILEQDAQTAGISRLARHILGALSIPMHLSGSSDRSVGGVSDISNRGHYDKLLLSELAQDDLLLTARLANNEALFLQREELPVNNSQQWHILLDTTLKMWGAPRVFGLAAGLAFAEGRKMKEPMNAWALGGRKATPVDLHSKEGIIATLEQLDPALHCGAELGKLLASQKGQKGKYIMITAAHYKDDTAFLAHFLPLKEQLDYLVVVSRDGHIELFETLGGRHKLLNQATIDLDSLLFARPKLPGKKYNTGGLPAMLQQTDFPLLFPASKVRMVQGHMFRRNNQEVVIISQDRRVLLWETADHGAIELIDHIEAGEYFWGNDGSANLFLLIKNLKNKFVIIYQLNIAEHSYNMVRSENLIADDVKFHGNLFHIKSGREVISIEPTTGKQVLSTLKFTTKTALGNTESTEKVTMSVEVFDQLQGKPSFNLVSSIKKFINDGYSVVNTITTMHIDDKGSLYLDKRQLFADVNGKDLFLKAKPGGTEVLHPVDQELMVVDHLSNLKFHKFIWKNGSEIVLDSRGMLHFKSANAIVSEFTVILVIDKPTAGWALDGTVAGSTYFTGHKPAKGINASDFYNNYIQPFIVNLA
jgi:hypothetical protein